MTSVASVTLKLQKLHTIKDPGPALQTRIEYGFLAEVGPMARLLALLQKTSLHTYCACTILKNTLEAKGTFLYMYLLKANLLSKGT